MIVHDAQRWVYLGIPKTASTALHRFLVEAHGARPVAPQHSMEVPEAYRGWRVFASSLNPFRRAHSLWRMFQGDFHKEAPWTRRFHPAVVDSFERYVEEVLLAEEIRVPVFQRPMIQWLACVPDHVRVTVIPAEDLRRGLRACGLLRRGESVPARNRTTQRLEPAYTPALEAAVRHWAAEDFRMLGYSAELAHWGRPPSTAGWGLRARLARSRARCFRAGQPCA